MMDPVSIALICAASFGALVALAAFLRMWFLSRDKKLNDEAQSRALKQETEDLEKIRVQMQNKNRFDTHYRLLGSNKEAILSIDKQIEELLQKKMQLVERFGQATIKQSEAIVGGDCSWAHKEACDKLKQEIDTALKFYDAELKQWQDQRKKLWDTRTDVQDDLLKQEKSHNEHLDTLYQQHSALLEKVYLRHIDEREVLASKNIDAGTTAFKWLAWGPMQFLLEYFNISTGIALTRSQMELMQRRSIAGLEIEINGLPPREHHHRNQYPQEKIQEAKYPPASDSTKSELAFSHGPKND